MPPITDLRNHVAGLLAAEFAADQVPVYADKLHGSLGQDGPICGLSPLGETPRAGNVNVANQRVLVQMFRRYETDPVDPAAQVDPTAIEAWAHRFQRAVAAAHRTGGSAWYAAVEEIAYPDDPMGNKSRFEAVVIGFASNPASPMTETQA